MTLGTVVHSESGSDQRGQQRLCGVDTVCGSREDAAGKTCPFPAGVKAPRRWGLAVFVPQDAHRGAAAALHRGQHRIGTVKSPDPAAQDGQGLGQRIHNKARQAPAQVCPDHAGTVGGQDLPRPDGGPSGQEILPPEAAAAMASASGPSSAERGGRFSARRSASASISSSSSACTTGW